MAGMEKVYTDGVGAWVACEERVEAAMREWEYAPGAEREDAGNVARGRQGAAELGWGKGGERADKAEEEKEGGVAVQETEALWTVGTLME